MNIILENILKINEALKYPFFKIQNYEISFWTIFIFIFILVVSKILARRLSKLITVTYFRKSNLEIGKQDAINKILHYTIYVFGIIIALQTVGIDLSALMAGGAVLAVGIGFGIQNLVTNFVAGILILVETPIKKGDFIEVGKDVFGVVTNIAIRNTAVKTLDNATILVPNSKFVSENITNFTYNNEIIKVKTFVSVPFSTDVKLIETLLVSIAKKYAEILTTPEPNVTLEIGSSALTFYLNFWIKDPLIYSSIKSKVNFGIVEVLKENSILK